MSLQEAQYTFLDKGTPAAKRMTSEKIAEFKGYNARGVREDGEMKDMSGLTSDEYPMLSVAKQLGEYGTATYTNPMQLLSKSHINDDGEMVDVLYAIASTAETVSGTNTDILYSGPYACYKNGTAISGLELSRDTQMVAINDKICFFPEKKWYSVKQGTVGDIEGYVSRSNVTVTFADDPKNNYTSSVLKFDQDMGLTSQFNVGDAVTINCDVPGSKMLIYRSHDCEASQVNAFLGVHVSTMFGRGWSGSFTIPFVVPFDTSVASRYVYVRYSTSGLEGHQMPKVGETDATGWGLFYSLAADGSGITITSSGYSGPWVSGIDIDFNPVRRSYYAPMLETNGKITLTDDLYVSPTFDTQEAALTWAETNYPESIADFNDKKSAWTKLYDASDITITKYSSTYKIKYADVGPSTTYTDGDVVTWINSGYVVDTIDAIVAGVNGTTAIIQSVTDTSISFPNNTFHDATGAQLTGESITFSPITISKPCPDLDFVIEWNNRLWGCSNADNTIYCSKLGDPTNWQYYQNTSLDSYFAEQGSNGRWTGVGKYSTHLLFFKEDCVHKVYGNYPSEFQIVTQMCSGVREGSHKSVVTMEDGVLYHSRRGIMAYTGGIPTLISTEFGKEKFSEAVAGTDGSKYYVALRNKSGTFYIFVYDVELGLWHRYIAWTVSDMEFHDGQLLIASMSLSRHKLKCIDDNGSEFVDYWYAVFGPFDEYIENEKIYSIISIRYELATGKKLKVQISMDDGAWEQIEEVTGGATTGHEIEFIPKRCDRFAIRLSGDGECKIKSLSRDFRVGSVQKENY